MVIILEKKVSYETRGGNIDCFIIVLTFMVCHKIGFNFRPSNYLFGYDLSRGSILCRAYISSLLIKIKENSKDL